MAHGLLEVFNGVLNKLHLFDEFRKHVHVRKMYFSERKEEWRVWKQT